MDYMARKSPLTVGDNLTLLSLGFSSFDIHVVNICLALTDDCGCSVVASNEIMKILGISERKFYYVLKKLKGLGLEKNNHRYDYSKVLVNINETTKHLTDA